MPPSDSNTHSDTDTADNTNELRSENPPRARDTPTRTPDRSLYGTLKHNIARLPGIHQYVVARNFFINALPGGTYIWTLVKAFIWLGVFVGVTMYLTGLTTPFAAVTSGSMEPEFERGDMAILANHSTDTPITDTTTLVTKHQSQTNTTITEHNYGDHGDIIVFARSGTKQPVIHRLHFRVSAGENWVARANSSLLNGNTCTTIQSCPAPHDGYITAGDNNTVYDQATSQFTVVRDTQIVGSVEYNVPHLGWLTLIIDDIT